MKTTIYITTILLIGFTTITCNKENSTNETKYTYLSQSIEPYKFETGTYWIFKNDSTNTIDSLVVINTENDFFWSPPPVHGQSGTKSEYFKMNIESSLTSDLYNDYLTSNYIKRNGGGEYGQNGQPIFIADSDIGTEFNGMEIIGKYQTLIINNHTFSDVVKSKITESQQYESIFINDTYLYYSNDIGLIKKVSDLGNGKFESWSIVRWNVKK